MSGNELAVIEALRMQQATQRTPQATGAPVGRRPVTVEAVTRQDEAVVDVAAPSVGRSGTPAQVATDVANAATQPNRPPPVAGNHAIATGKRRSVPASSAAVSQPAAVAPVAASPTPPSTPVAAFPVSQPTAARPGSLSPRSGSPTLRRAGQRPSAHSSLQPPCRACQRRVEANERVLLSIAAVAITTANFILLVAGLLGVGA